MIHPSSVIHYWSQDSIVSRSEECRYSDTENGCMSVQNNTEVAAAKVRILAQKGAEQRDLM